MLQFVFHFWINSYAVLGFQSLLILVLIMWKIYKSYKGVKARFSCSLNFRWNSRLALNSWHFSGFWGYVGRCCCCTFFFCFFVWFVGFPAQFAVISSHSIYEVSLLFVRRFENLANGSGVLIFPLFSFSLRCHCFIKQMRFIWHIFAINLG